MFPGFVNFQVRISISRANDPGFMQVLSFSSSLVQRLKRSKISLHGMKYLYVYMTMQNILSVVSCIDI